MLSDVALMFGILVEKQVAVLATSNLVLTDEGTAVDFVVGAGVSFR